MEHECSTCTFKVRAGGLAVPLGGQFAYDSGRKLLYFSDNSSASQGVDPAGLDPSGDAGHGLLDFNSTFTLAGGAWQKRQFHRWHRLPHAGNRCTAQLGSPESFGRSVGGNGGCRGEIIRFTSPGTAVTDGFSSCAQFVQIVGTTPDNTLSIGLAWIGHDLWGADGVAPYVIANADTACLVPPRTACSTANGTVTSALPAVGVALAVSPATNSIQRPMATTSILAREARWHG